MPLDETVWNILKIVAGIGLLTLYAVILASISEACIAQVQRRQLSAQAQDRARYPHRGRSVCT